ncbi:HMG box-containing protein [Elsinoe australis]|uniref:HMG box-containing protein n=1 Tax=Elsinoe australis TaxID=40998 RepID=A0A2P7Z2Y5_9PEZI|nr:HMG box-containing protein [Elsinoe australis]
MARKNIDSTAESAGSVPVSKALSTRFQVATTDEVIETTPTKAQSNPRKRPETSRKPEQHLNEIERESLPTSKHGLDSQPATGRRVRLLPVVNSLATRTDHLAASGSFLTPARKEKASQTKVRATPARSVRKPATYRETKIIDLDSSEESEVEESIWCDGKSEASDFESDASLDSPIQWPADKIKAPSPAKKGDGRPRSGKSTLPLTTETNLPQLKHLTLNGRESDFSDKENSAKDPMPARPLTPPGKTTTATASPSKSRLASPSKQRIRVPTPPGRPSLDNFWDANEVNDWNDKHSPRKPLLSPSKHRFLYPSSFSSPAQPALTATKTKLLSEGSSPLDPSTPSGRKSPTKTPLPPSPQKSPKKTKAEVHARKTFDETKEQIALDFIIELDERICQGKISEATRSTGGIKIVWSKSLNSTAGRASWKRETVRSKGPSPSSTSAPTSTSSSSPSSFSSSRSSTPTPSFALPSSSSSSSSSPTTQYKHHAQIELATKVLTSPDRLHNTLAHEFCHLATYIISGVKDRPHGVEFKSWGAKCSAVFKDRGVKVTTKHSYEIEWRYLWVCAGRAGTAPTPEGGQRQGRDQEAIGQGDQEGHMCYDGGCGREYGRHSKSIDPAKVRCGVCKGRLVQVRPVPRKGGKEAGGFAGFVKEEFGRVKGEMEGRGHGEVMAELGRRYRALKTGDGQGRGTGEGELEALVKGMEVVVVSDG